VDDRTAPTVRVLVAQLDGPGASGTGEALTLAQVTGAAGSQPAAKVTADGGAPAATTIAIDTAHHWAEAQALLAPGEAERAGRLRDVRDRQTYVYAHALLRLLLARELGGNPAALEFVAGAHGKPRLAPAVGQLHFSLSYRRGMVLVATGSAPLGIDVEAVRPGIDMLGVAQRFFTTEEQAFLQAAAPGELAQRFFGLWTRKEALVKAAGVGVDLMTAAGALKSRATLADEYGAVKPYCVHQLASAGNYAMALAVELSHPPSNPWPNRTMT